MLSGKTITPARSAKTVRIFRAGVLIALSSVVVQQALARLEIMVPAAESQHQAAAPGSWETIEGVIQTFWIDFPDHARRVDYLVSADRTIELKYTRQQRRPLAGTSASVTGRLDGDYLALDPTDVEATGTNSAGTTTGLLPNVFGAQQLLVIPVRFQADLSEPWTSEAISQLVFGEADAYFRDVSRGRTWFEGEVTPWVTVDNDPNICDPGDPLAIAVAAEAEALKIGFDAEQYDRMIYMVPALDCGWAGVAGVGTRQAWLRFLDFKVTVHELGHNFGLPHAHSAVCLAGDIWSWPNGCTNYEYGDIFDVMGASSGAEFGVLHQRRLGYLDTDPGRYTTLVDLSGDYQIGSYAAADSLSRALRIPAGFDIASGLARTLYVSRREPIGRDTVLGSNLAADQTRIRNGVAIHIGFEESGDGALIDTTPLTRDGITDLQDAPLLVGEAYIDPLSGITVAPVAVEPGVATVAVTLGPTAEPVPQPADNRPPEAVDDFVEGVAGKSIEIPVLINDFDPDYDPLVITYLSVPLFGSVSLDSSGIPVYRAPRKFQGIDTFSYEISDGVAQAAALVTVTVNAGTKVGGRTKEGGGTKGGGRKK